MLELEKIFTPKAMAARWDESANLRIPYLGEGLFPAVKQAGLDLKWIRGSKGLPVSLMPSAFDAKATFRDRIGVSTILTEMPFFREGFKIKERDRQDLLRAMSTNDPFAAATIERIFNDGEELLEGARVARERLRMSLLFPVNGDLGISIKANGVDYTYNFDADGSWKAANYRVLVSGLWNVANAADPLGDIEAAKEAKANQTGAVLRYAVMNSNTFNNMLKADSIKNRYMATNGLAIGYLTRAELRSVVEKTTEVIPVVYDKQYKDEDKVAHKYVPDGYVALIPDGSLGNTHFGTTPEEADLIGNAAADVAIVDTGVALTRIVDPHPVNVNLFASMIALPSFERMDDVTLMKVY